MRTGVRLKKIALIIAMGLGLNAQAQTSTDAANTTAPASTVKASDVTPAAANDIDNEITNAKLRASSVGSKSKLSLKADISYNGGNFETPFGEKRPNYAGAPGTVKSSSISGTIGAAYRLTDRDVMRFGTGVSLQTPFQDHASDLTNSNGRKTDASNPYLDYSHAVRVGNAQNIFDTSVTMFTQDAYVNGLNMIGTLDANHTIAWEFKSTKWSPGINSDINYTFYKVGATDADTITNSENGFTDLTVAFFPYVEYAFTEKLSFRTVFRFLTFDHYRSDNSTTFGREKYTQSVGIGIAATRDIYFYPNIQWAPEATIQDKTNIGLSASINL